MTDDQNTHEDIARLLREQGPVEAPPDLAASVMEEVRRIPRQHPVRDRWVRRAAQWSVAAAALVAIGFGLSRADMGGSSSSSVGATSGGGAAEGAKSAASPTLGSVNGTATQRTFELPALAARSVLGALYTPADAADGRIVLTLSPSQFHAYARKLRSHEPEDLSAAPGAIVTVVLRKSP